MHNGLKIKELRELKLWTQEQLAEIAGISERTVRRFESTGNVQNATLLSIMEALGTNLEKLNKMDSSTDKSIENASLLHRIENGRELVKIVCSSDQLAYDYYDCNNEELIHLAQNFLSNVVDILDIWSDLEIGEKFGIENDLTKEIKLMDENGLWIFGGQFVKKDQNLTTASIDIYSKNNPMILKFNWINTN